MSAFVGRALNGIAENLVKVAMSVASAMTFLQSEGFQLIPW